MRQAHQRVGDKCGQAPGADLYEDPRSRLIQSPDERAEANRFEQVAGGEMADAIGVIGVALGCRG
jgi:hypothetical protein